MKKRMFATLLTTFLCSSMLAGCGGASGGENSSAETTAGNAAAAENSTGQTETAGADLELSISWWGGDVRNQYTQELVNEYGELNPGITFSTSPTSWDGYFEKLSTQAAGGNLPDIFQMDYLYITTYANNDTLADLTPFIENGTLDVSTIDEALLNSGKIGDLQAGIPLSTSVLTLPYNPEVLKEAGIEELSPNWTWEDFEKICLQVKEKTGKYGYAQNYTDVNLLHYYLRQYGISLFNETGTALGYEDDAHTTEYIALHQRLTEAGAMPTPDEWITISANSMEAGPLPTNQGAINYSSNTYAYQVKEANPSLLLSAPPINEGSEKALWLKPGMFFCVPATASAEEQQAAVDFINWFINSEQAADKIGTERGIPASSTVREYLASGDLDQKSKEMFEFYDQAAALSGECPPPDPEGISEVNQAFVSVMDQVMYGQMTPEEAAAKFRTQANEILARKAQ